MAVLTSPHVVLIRSHTFSTYRERGVGQGVNTGGQYRESICRGSIPGVNTGGQYCLTLVDNTGQEWKEVNNTFTAIINYCTSR